MADVEPDAKDAPPRPLEVWSVLIEGAHVDKVRPVVVMANYDD